MSNNKAISSLKELWLLNHIDIKNNYVSRKLSFIKDLLPEQAVQLPPFEILSLLEQKYGLEKLKQAIDPISSIPSPVLVEPDSQWLKNARMTGINVRTIGNFFNIIKYCLTLGDSINAIHILPIWEPGVVGSLYGKTSWNINTEFFSEELYQVIPSLNTAEKQLKVTVNILHLMGKTVGLDVIPHTDRFSEIVFLNPRMFEWVERKDHQILDFNGMIPDKVQEIVWQYLLKNGTADGSNLSYGKEVFFECKNFLLSDAQKQGALFGKIEDYQTRLRRRIELMKAVLYGGFETLPVTMAPPYRGLKLIENDFISDNINNKWYNYHFIKPEKMSRVFGPLTRYKLYESGLDQNLDFNSPITETWDYLKRQYQNCINYFDFDFMRGDMAHVQPRKEGVPATISKYYDPLLSIKKHIQKNGKPYFGFFAETFLAPPDTMGYGVEEHHLEAIEADATLGDIQAEVVSTDKFRVLFNRYIELKNKYDFAPNFTIITADKDDPRFDEFYKKGKHLRVFISLFYENLPSYTSLNFECRNDNLQRGKNEAYTKLYVFRIEDDNEVDKVTHGPFIWGQNEGLFLEIQKLKMLFEELKISEKSEMLHLATEMENYFSWKRGEYTFMSNFSENGSLPELVGEVIYDSSLYTKDHRCLIIKV